MKKSTSLDPDGDEAAWRRASLTLVCTFFCSLVVFLLLIVVVDPYDSGRFPTFMSAGSPDELPPTIGISRGRDPRFNAIMLGSSRAVLVDPRHVSDLTGYRFVQMAAEGAVPRDQMALLHWFARHRVDVEAIVVATDQTWCMRDPASLSAAGFPYGLYGDSYFDYFVAAMSSASFRYGRERLLYALGWMPGVDPAGFFDTEAKRNWRWPRDEPLEWKKASAEEGPLDLSFPALTLLDTSLKRLSGHPPVLLWMPPYFHSALPPPDSAAGRELAACKQALRRWADNRPRSFFLDLATDTPANRDRLNFLDPTHVRKRLTPTIEIEIAAALSRAQ